MRDARGRRGKEVTRKEKEKDYVKELEQFFKCQFSILSKRHLGLTLTK